MGDAMRKFIRENPGRTLFVSLLGAISVCAAGAVLIASGVPPATMLGIQLALWFSWLLFVPIAGDDRLSGLLGMIFACLLPWFIPVVLVELALVASPALGGTLAAAGLVAIATIALGARSPRAAATPSHRAPLETPQLPTSA